VGNTNNAFSLYFTAILYHTRLFITRAGFGSDRLHVGGGSR